MGNLITCFLIEYEKEGKKGMALEIWQIEL